MEEPTPQGLPLLSSFSGWCLFWDPTEGGETKLSCSLLKPPHSSGLRPIGVNLPHIPSVLGSGNSPDLSSNTQVSFVVYGKEEVVGIPRGF